MSDLDLVSRRMLKALSADVDDDETATDATAEVGWLVAEVRGLHGRVNLLIALRPVGARPACILLVHGARSRLSSRS